MGFKLVEIPLLVLFIILLMSVDRVDAVESRPLNNILIISVGGLNYEGYVSANMANMKCLGQDGVLCEKALAVQADTIESAETSIFTGAMAEEHKHLTAEDKVEVESVFDILRKYGKSSLIIDGSGGKLQSFARSEKEYFKLPVNSSSREVFERAFEQLNKDKSFFTYLYINNCVQELLKQDEKAYYEALKTFDNELGNFINKLKKNDLYNNSLIIISSARSSSPSNLVPLLIHGPRCKVNNRIESSMVIDIIPTVCCLIEVEPPFSSRGIPIYAALKVDDEEQLHHQKKWIDELQKDRFKNWNSNYEIMEELDRTIRQMVSIKEEKQSIFDFAGERERVIAALRTKLNIERAIWGVIILFMLLGYIIEYYYLKRKYLLFK